MRAKSQKYHSLVRKILAKAEFTLWDGAAFFTNDKDDAEVAVNPRTPAANQIQSATGIRQSLCVVIRIFEYPFNLLSDLRLQR